MSTTADGSSLGKEVVEMQQAAFRTQSQLRLTRVVRARPVLLLMASLAACTTVTVHPEVPASVDPAALSGRVQTKGSTDFLPASLQGISQAAQPTFLYDYDVQYSDTDLGLLAAFNPLSLLGLPTGSASVHADATLEVTRDDRLLKAYQATAVASVTRTIYSGESMSALRRKALLAVAESIGAQMSQDRHPFEFENESEE